MNKIISEIRKIINKEQKLIITFLGDEIWFLIYETEIPIIVDTKKKYIYIECETMNHKIDEGMLKELNMIMLVIKENLEEILILSK